MGNSASALPYSIDSTVDYTTSDGWSVSGGTKKADGTKVTVFHVKKPLLKQRNTLFSGSHHFVQAKKLRHPHLLQVYATLDTDAPASDGSDASGGAPPAKKTAPTTPLAQQTGDYIIVTEPCIPLEEWLNTSPSQQELTWALHCMVQALGFLHSSASLAHGNLSPESWKVTLSGDVKLWNYGICTTNEISSHFQQYEQQATPLNFRSPERQNRDFHSLQKCGIHSIDSYGLGILIRDVLFPNSVPPSLQKALQRLIGSNPKSRPRVVGLLKCPLFNSPYITLQQQLLEIQIQPVEQKISFWQSLQNNLASVSESLSVYKLLPLLQTSITTICSSESLLRQDLYKREVLSMLPILFGIWERFPNECELDFAPTIGLLMRVQDRAIRGALLQKMAVLERQISNKSQVNSHVFEPMCSGFSDSSAALRELTLKSSLALIPHLSPTNLEKLSRYLVRLQADTEPSIRTNSIVLIIKVTPQLTPVQQEKLFFPSLTRALNDGFDPCRLAVLGGILNYEGFTPEMYAKQVLPIVTPKLLDSCANVRARAFQVVDKSVALLRQEHARMSQEEATNAAAATGGMTQPQQAVPPASVAAAPASGGYLSGLSSWMSSSTKPETSDGAAAPSTAAASYGGAPPQRPSTATPVVQPQQATTAPSMMAMTNQFAATSLNANANDGWDDVDDDNDDDGWGDDDDDDLLGMTTSPPKTTTAPANKPASSLLTQPANLNMKEEEDFFASFDTKKVPLKTTGGKLAVPASKKAAAPPKITKLKVDASDWDDF